MPSRRSRFSDDHLLDATRTVLLQVGYDSATMEGIAARAGTTKPTLYARYGDKATLATACARRDCDRLRDHLVAVYEEVRGTPPHEQVHRGMHALADAAADDPDGFALVTQVEWPGKFEVTEELLAALAHHAARSFEESIRALGDEPGPFVADLAAMVVSVGWRAALQSHGEGPDRVAALADLASELVLDRLPDVTRSAGSRTASPGSR